MQDKLFLVGDTVMYYLRLGLYHCAVYIGNAL